MVNTHDSQGNTPLHIAIKEGHIDCCLFLLNKGADTNIRNESNLAPLHQCVISNQPNILELLINHHSRPDIFLNLNSGENVLHLCAYRDNYECAKILINKDSELIKKSCDYNFHPIHIAAQNGSNRVFEFLITEGYKFELDLINLIDGDNNKILNVAVQFGNLDCVKLCLENGCIIDEIKEPDGTTPVHVASAQGSLEILKLMFEKQTNLFKQVIKLKDKMNLTPLHNAVMFNQVDAAEFLIENGSNIDELDSEMRSPICFAAYRNFSEIVNLLFDRKADLEIKDLKKRNFLHLIFTQELSNFTVIEENTDSASKSNLNRVFEQITKHILSVNIQ